LVISTVLTGLIAVTVGLTEVAVHSLATKPQPRVVNAFQVDRAVPNFGLLSSSGQPTSLTAFRGKVVVLTPSLTLCSEVCPLTTGAFLRMQRDVRDAGLASRVVFVEASVDPWRDSPSRLRAFAKLTGATFTLLTGTKSELHHLWSFLGVGYQRIPQGKPAAIDWLTHKPQTFDVQHTDGLFFIDPRGHLRLITLGMPSLDGHLTPTLQSLLSTAGLQDLTHPQFAGWTVPQALQNLATLVGRPIPDKGM
jgi:cytochrome oxidase Cu insertion factor (SCO1/SenC/PrrC family)